MKPKVAKDDNQSKYRPIYRRSCNLIDDDDDVSTSNDDIISNSGAKSQNNERSSNSSVSSLTAALTIGVRLITNNPVRKS